MAEVNSQIDILNHLLEVEKDVSLLIEQAVTDSEKKISDAKVTANAKFQKQNALTQSELEKDYEVKLQALKDNRDKTIQNFTDSLHNRKQDTNALNKCLDALLFAK